MSLSSNLSSAVTFATAAAGRTGLLGELLRGPETAGELAHRLGLDARATALVLELLATTELAERQHVERFAAGPQLRELASRPGGAEFTLGLWAHVEEFLRTGEPWVAMDRSPDERGQAYRSVVGGLGALFEQAARDLAAQLPIVPRRILDVGCGSGVWSLAFAERHPEATATGLDLPAVLDNYRARATALGLGDRTQTIAGDMHATEFPARAFDLVILANVLRLETPERAENLLRRLVASVAPGGALLVIDSLAEGTPEKERERAAYVLHHGLRMRTGSVHRTAEISRWLAKTPLSCIATIDVADGAGGLGAVLATEEAL